MFIAHTSNGLNKRRYMDINNVIEEVDEDKNNDNTNMTKSRISISKEENNSKIKSRNINIQILRDSTYEVKDLKRELNNFNQIDNSLAMRKEKNRSKINISSKEKLSFTFRKKSNNLVNTLGEKNDSKKNDISKISLPILNNPSTIFPKKKLLNNFHNETSSTNAYTNSSKNNIRNIHNLTEKINKFRISLFSANSISNSTIIPYLPIERPASNFNFGGNQLWETDNINKINKKSANNFSKNIKKNKFLMSDNIKLGNIIPSNQYKSRSSEHRTDNMNNIINLKTKFHRFVKDKENDSKYNNKLNEFEILSNYIKKNNNIIFKKNCNKSLNLKK